MTEHQQVTEQNAANAEHRINIQIDRVHYVTETETMTGAQVRALPATPIPGDRDLFLVVAGGPDRKIADVDIITLHNGMRFFTAPGQINPGSTMSYA